MAVQGEIKINLAENINVCYNMAHVLCNFPKEVTVMDLTMDGRKVLPQPGQSLLELVKQLGLGGSALTKRPLAAKIAGEVFTLNYIPVRQKEAEADRQSMRRAMAASNGEIRLLRYADPAGKECYIRTAQFAIFLAMGQLWPEATAKMTCTLGSSVYISVAGARDFSASTLKARVSELVGQDIPLIRRRENVPHRQIPGGGHHLAVVIVGEISVGILVEIVCRPPG